MSENFEFSQNEENYWNLDFSSELKVRSYGNKLIEKIYTSLDLGDNTRRIKEKLDLMKVLFQIAKAEEGNEFFSQDFSNGLSHLITLHDENSIGWITLNAANWYVEKNEDIGDFVTFNSKALFCSYEDGLSSIALVYESLKYPVEEFHKRPNIKGVEILTQTDIISTLMGSITDDNMVALSNNQIIADRSNLSEEYNIRDEYLGYKTISFVDLERALRNFQLPTHLNIKL